MRILDMRHLLLILSLAQTLVAGPVNQDTEFHDPNNSTLGALEERGCPVPCGWHGKYCCEYGQACYTNRWDKAYCANGAPTTTFASYVPPATTTPSRSTTTEEAAKCKTSRGETPCGPICCASYQYCKVEGQCETSGYTSFQSFTYSAPLRVTSVGTSFAAATVQPTTTVAFQPAVTTGSGVTVSSSGSSTSLSAGAIAGIVIGVIFGLLLLIILCLIFCFGAAWRAILGFFGIGTGRKRREVTEYEYHRSGSRGGARTWYGSGRPQRPPQKKGGGFGWGTVAAGLGALGVGLGLKRRYDRKRTVEEEKDSYVSYDYSDYTASSSDRRTRDTRR